MFGYAAFKPVLVKEGVYRDYCDEEERDLPGTCYEQEIRCVPKLMHTWSWLTGTCRLNLMFTTAAVATNVCALPVGTILDKYGPRVCGIIGSVLLAIGSVFFIFASDVPFDAYIPGYFFLALGGPFIFISSFQLSNAFPRNSGLILALLTGAFDSSSAIFLFYRLIYAATAGAFTPQKLFLVYLIVPIFILVAQVFIMPGESYKTIGELVKAAEDPSNDTDPRDSEINDPTVLERVREERRIRRESILSELTPLIGKKSESTQQAQEQRKQAISGVWGALHGQSALQQIKTPWFILVLLFVVVQMTRINYFVATIRPQYEYLLRDAGLAEHVNNFFDVALPVGGVLSIPFIGLVLDNTSTTFVLGLLVTVATAIGVLGILPYMWAAYANIVLFVIYRPLYYTAVSDYAAKVFGFHTFGKVYGLIICLAGLFNFSQSALDALTHKGFDGNPVPVDVLLLVLVAVIGVFLIGYVWRQSIVMRTENEESEEERPSFNGFNFGSRGENGTNGTA